VAPAGRHHRHRCPALWGPLIGPVVSLLSFVCSIGNVPLAGVLWNGGISFGGFYGVVARRAGVVLVRSGSNPMPSITVCTWAR
jgi:hypothetical protein